MMTRQLVFRYLSNQASPLERQHIQQWLQHGGQEQFFRWVEEWERLHPQMPINTDHAWSGLQARVRTLQNETLQHTPMLPTIASESQTTLHQSPHHSLHQRVTPTVRRPSAWTRWTRWRMMPLRMAALLALTVGLVSIIGSVWLWHGAWYEALAVEHHRTSSGELRSLTLADGSRVTLNANSELAVPRFGFMSDRRVELRGEAEFSVTHTSTNAPFVVATPSGMQVRVLGTEFVVFSRERGEKVALLKGAVQVKMPVKAAVTMPERSPNSPMLNSPMLNSPMLSRANVDTTTIKLAPGDVLTRDIHNGLLLTKQQHVAAYTTWKEHRFQFNNTALDEVAAQIHDYFGLDVRIEGTRLSDRYLSGSFPADDPDTLLQALSVALSCSVQRVDRTVILH
jgi:ferric-dicitrate binding protein FerR (iron transport regulator)